MIFLRKKTADYSTYFNENAAAAREVVAQEEPEESVQLLPLALFIVVVALTYVFMISAHIMKQYIFVQNDGNSES